jgi:hypothetical protein
VGGADAEFPHEPGAFTDQLSETEKLFPAKQGPSLGTTGSGQTKSMDLAQETDSRMGSRDVKQSDEAHVENEGTEIDSTKTTLTDLQDALALYDSGDSK